MDRKALRLMQCKGVQCSAVPAEQKPKGLNKKSVTIEALFSVLSFLIPFPSFLDICCPKGLAQLLS